MSRFFMAASNIGKGIAILTGNNAEHAKVLRLRVGDRITVCDGAGTDHRCLIKSISREAVETEIEDSAPCPNEPTVSATIYCGLPKTQEKMDYIVQKCTESGASSVVFFHCERCVTAPDEKSIEKKLERLRRIALEAAKQSQRGIVPEIAYMPSFDEMLAEAKQADLPLFLYETGDRVTIKAAIESGTEIKTAALITGPEGGFEAWEAEMARLSGIAAVSMGPRIFRCETAPVAALIALMYGTENL